MHIRSESFFKKLARQTVVSFLIVMLVVPWVGIVAPKKAEAFLGFGDIVSDPWNTFQNTISAGANALTSGLQTSLNLKEFALDAIAYAIAKQILRSMTTSVVQWINSGFEGSPSFLTNPAGFFEGVGDEIIGNALASDSRTAWLCSPFSIDVRLSLAFKYRPFQKRASCTLSQVLDNSGKAIDNASINGFRAGDFKNGGWPTLLTMSTEPQNNQYGAAVQADYEIGFQIGKYNALKRDELNQGKGFLSYTTCKEDIVPGDDEFAGSPTNRQEDRSNLPKDFTGPGKPKTCTTQTPGSVISSSLENVLGSPVRELELADEINEIVNALFAQMVQRVLIGGLRGATGKGPSDPNALINQISQEKSAANNEQLTGIRAGILSNVDIYLGKEQTYRDSKQQSLDIVLKTKKAYEGASACFTTKIAALGNTPVMVSRKNEGLDQIRIIEHVVASRVVATSSKLLTDVTAADTRINRLNSIKQSATIAQTVNDLITSTADMQVLAGGTELHNEREVAAAKIEIDATHDQFDSLYTDANRRLQACQVYPEQSVVIPAP
jgi:hypothetical protein